MNDTAFQKKPKHFQKGYQLQRCPTKIVPNQNVFSLLMFFFPLIVISLQNPSRTLHQATCFSSGKCFRSTISTIEFLHAWCRKIHKTYHNRTCRFDLSIYKWLVNLHQQHYVHLHNVINFKRPTLYTFTIMVTECLFCSTYCIS